MPQPELPSPSETEVENRPHDIGRKAAIEVDKEAIALARKGVLEPDEPLLKQIAGLGVTVTQLTPTEREALVKAMRPCVQPMEGPGGHRLGEHDQEGDCSTQAVSE